MRGTTRRHIRVVLPAQDVRGALECVMADSPTPLGVAVDLPHTRVDPNADCSDECRLAEVGSKAGPEVVIEVRPPMEGARMERHPVPERIEEGDEKRGVPPRRARGRQRRRTSLPGVDHWAPARHRLPAGWTGQAGEPPPQEQAWGPTRWASLRITRYGCVDHFRSPGNVALSRVLVGRRLLPYCGASPSVDEHLERVVFRGVTEDVIGLEHLVERELVRDELLEPRDRIARLSRNRSADGRRTIRSFGRVAPRRSRAGVRPLTVVEVGGCSAGALSRWSFP